MGSNKVGWGSVDYGHDLIQLDCVSLVLCCGLFHCHALHFVDQLEGFSSGFIQTWPNWAFYHKLGYGENFLLRDYIYLKFRISQSP